MASDKGLTRRRYSAALKAQVVAECAAVGASVARVALAHGINANVVHRWRQLAREAHAAPVGKTLQFLPLPLASSHSMGSLRPHPTPHEPPGGADIRVELSKGPLLMRVSWPTSAASDFAAWTRELLR